MFLAAAGSITCGVSKEAEAHEPDQELEHEVQIEDVATADFERKRTAKFFVQALITEEQNGETKIAKWRKPIRLRVKLNGNDRTRELFQSTSISTFQPIATWWGSVRFDRGATDPLDIVHESIKSLTQHANLQIVSAGDGDLSDLDLDLYVPHWQFRTGIFRNLVGFEISYPTVEESLAEWLRSVDAKSTIYQLPWGLLEIRTDVDEINRVRMWMYYSRVPGT